MARFILYLWANFSEIDSDHRIDSVILGYNVNDYKKESQ